MAFNFLGEVIRYQFFISFLCFCLEMFVPAIKAGSWLLLWLVLGCRIRINLRGVVDLNKLPQVHVNYNTAGGINVGDQELFCFILAKKDIS